MKKEEAGVGDAGLQEVTTISTGSLPSTTEIAPSTADTNQAQLVKVIKAHLAKGEQHFIAAGQYLKQLKSGLSQAEFLEIVREKIGIGKSRTYELLAIADGTKTVEQVRAGTAKRTADTKARLKLSASSGQNADEPEALAEAKKAKFVLANFVPDHEDSFLDDEGNFAPVDPGADAACRIRGFLYLAQQSVFAAEAENFKGLACTKEMLQAAEDVIKAWTEARDALRNKVRS
jgi:hypothetical protein